MKVAPATSSLIPPVTKRGYFTPKQKILAAMKVASATPKMIPPIRKCNFTLGLNRQQP